MKSNQIQEFTRLRQQLSTERGRIQERLRQINEALGSLPTPSMGLVDGATSTPSELAGNARGGARRRGGKRRKMSPEARARIAAAARERWAKVKASGGSRL